MEVFQSCSQFVEQGHIFLEKAERDFHYLIFDEFEKIHTETEFTDDIADVLSEFIMWFPEEKDFFSIARRHFLFLFTKKYVKNRKKVMREVRHILALIRENPFDVLKDYDKLCKLGVDPP